MIEIEPRHVTFIAPPGTTALVGDFTDWQSKPIPLKPGERVRLEFPRKAFVEYAFLDESGTPFADPDNDRESENPWYRYPRAAVLPGYEPTPFREPLEGIPAGTLERLTWEGRVFAGTRRALVYTPANVDSKSEYPVFYVQDGVAYARTGRLGVVMDHLLAQKRVRPAIFAFLEPADRTREYFLNKDYNTFLREEAIPTIESRYPVSRERSGRGLWGASLGGLAAFYAVLEAPELFSNLVVQSGGFQAEPARPPEPRGQGEWIIKAFAALEPADLRVSLECGELEWLLGANRRMAGVLFDRGYRHRYAERPSGHNWITWRDGLADALEYMLGPL